MPWEILCKIVDELDDVSKVCLKSTSYHFHCAIKVDVTKLSVCIRWMLLCRFETDYHALMKSYPPRVACALCKVKVRQECIEPKKHRNIRRSCGIGTIAPMRKEPVGRVCVLHAPPLFRRDTSFQDPRENNPPIFTKKSQLMCMHCGRDVEAHDRRSVGCDTCRCSVCPRVIQPIYELSGYPSRRRYHYYPRFIKDRSSENGLAICDYFSNVL